MEVSLGYGKKTVTCSINDENFVKQLLPNKVDHGLKGADEVKRALNQPIGTPLLSEIVKPGEKIAIVTSDITRPMPSRVVLPIILEELESAGINHQDIMIIFALGSHRKHTEDEMKELVGKDVFSKIKCIDSDVNECQTLGSTSRGTPISLFRPLLEADRRICVGNIEYHYFAGYSGGAKAIMPGVSTRQTIQSNHSMMVQDDAKAGSLDHNPLRCDIEEVTDYVSIDFILNVVLNEKKEIIYAVSGHHREAHRVGCDYLDMLYKVEIDRLADIVIVSPGGFPKDINVYQAQKALDNAKHAVKEDGIIIWVASCNEGLGENVFERWINEADSPKALIDRVQTNFELGGHKAAAIAMVLQKARVFLVSDLEKNYVKNAFLEPYETLDEAINQALQIMGSKSDIFVMPYGGSTLPVINNL